MKKAKIIEDLEVGIEIMNQGSNKNIEMKVEIDRLKSKIKEEDLMIRKMIEFHTEISIEEMISKIKGEEVYQMIIKEIQDRIISKMIGIEKEIALAQNPHTHHLHPFYQIE